MDPEYCLVRHWTISLMKPLKGKDPLLHKEVRKKV